MKNINYLVAETCDVTCVNNGKKVEAEVLKFKSNRLVTVVFEKQVKLNLVWNGSEYIGTMGKLDFKSAGPEVSAITY